MYVPDTSNFVDETNKYNLKNNNSFEAAHNDNSLVTSPTSAASYEVSPTYQSIFANTLTSHGKQQFSDTCSNNSSMSNAL